MAHKATESTKLAPPEFNTAQQVIGTFLYYTLTVNTTMLVVLNSTIEEKANRT